MAESEVTKVPTQKQHSKRHESASYKTSCRAELHGAWATNTSAHTGVRGPPSKKSTRGACGPPNQTVHATRPVKGKEEKREKENGRGGTEGTRRTKTKNG